MKRPSSATKKQSESIVSDALSQSKGMSNEEIIKKISNDRKSTKHEPQTKIPPRS